MDADADDIVGSGKQVPCEARYGRVVGELRQLVESEDADADEVKKFAGHACRK